MNGNENRDLEGQQAQEAKDREMDIDVPEGAVEIPVEIVGEEKAEAAEAAGSAGEDAGTSGKAAGEPALEELSPEEMAARVEQARAELEAVKKACEEEIRDIRMRGQAELENFKKRLNREHSDHLKFAAENVMKELIPSLDNLELAIAYGSKDEACQNLLQGVEMTQKLLLEAVGRHGLTRVGNVGDPFDPALHEAIGTESREDMEENAVSRVMQSGYSLHDRLLRPAKVMVNKR